MMWKNLCDFKKKSGERSATAEKHRQIIFKFLKDQILQSTL